MHNIYNVLGSLAFVTVITFVPFVSSAHELHASNTTAVAINSHGIIRLVGAEVTAVTNGVVDATVTFGSTIMHWFIDTTTTTKIFANDSKNASTTALAVGDRISVVGSLSSTSSPFTIVATKIHDWTTFHGVHKHPHDKDD